MRRAAIAILLALCLGLPAAGPAAAAPPPVPDPKPKQRVVDNYPEQMPAAGIEGIYAPGVAGFLTLPYLGGGHFVSSNFDHCGPNYLSDGVICRFDGTVAYAGSGRDPDAPTGYAMSAGKDDYLYYDGHDGVDLGLYYEPVVAAADGVVTYADWSTPGCARCSFGQGVRIDHGNGFDTLYGHLWRLQVRRGQRVRRGQVLGISGNSGASTGEHLHFGVYRHGTWTPLDPYGWSGAGPDPWPHDAGNLWIGGAAHSPAVARPAVTADAQPAGEDDMLVSWKSPGDDVHYDVTLYRDGEAGVAYTTGTVATSALVHGDPGHSYWFLVTAHTSLGLSDGNASPVVTVFGSGAPNR
ncbi:MAG: hypothetical protein NVS9B1_21020 [Candidatus Dormibacteraceae bacterium]